MIIYGALLIPIITAILLFMFYERVVVWWEFLIPFLASLILIVSMKCIIEQVQVSSKEYFGSIVARIEYYEDWNEWITQTCTRSCCCDSKGENCGTETYDCSYCRYHPAEWRIVCTTGETVSISQTEYEHIKGILGNESFSDLHRDYYTDDGDEYFCVWNNDSSSAVPVTTVHRYENRVKAADQSVFHYEAVSKADVKRYALKDYPDMAGSYQLQSVIGDSSAEALLADKKFNYINGLLGHKRQVRIFVLIFHDQPYEASIYQEWYWQGGNKNEFVICIGIDKAQHVKWCRPVSWTRSENLKAEVKSFVQNQSTLNLLSLADFAQAKIGQQFVRRSFKEFDYLTVVPPLWAVLLTYLLTLLVNLGLSKWIIENEIQ